MDRIRVICNTSPIIGLMSIGKISLLWELFDEVMIPEAVERELCAGTEKHYGEAEQVKKYIQEDKLKICKIKNVQLIKALYGRLHYGELEVIIGAKEYGISLAIIDEKAARKMASDFLIDTIGIFGILSLAKKRGFLDSIKDDMDCLRKNGYRVSDELYQKVLEYNGEA